MTFALWVMSFVNPYHISDTWMTIRILGGFFGGGGQLAIALQFYLFFSYGLTHCCHSVLNCYQYIKCLQENLHFSHLSPVFILCCSFGGRGQGALWKQQTLLLFLATSRLLPLLSSIPPPLNCFFKIMPSAIWKAQNIFSSGKCISLNLLMQWETKQLQPLLLISPCLQNHSWNPVCLCRYGLINHSYSYS